MLKLLLYLLIAYIVYVIVKFWVGVFKSIFNIQRFKKQFQNAQQGRGQNTANNHTQSRQEGDVTINYAKKENSGDQKKSRTDDIGEYIDYEEIK